MGYGLPMNIKRVATVVVLAASILGGQIHESFSVKPAPAHFSKLVDCEDMDVQPCFTYDEGKWKVVYSYKPYTAKNVKVCNKAKRNEACISKPKNGTVTYVWYSRF